MSALADVALSVPWPLPRRAGLCPSFSPPGVQHLALTWPRFLQLWCLMSFMLASAANASSWSLFGTLVSGASFISIGEEFNGDFGSDCLGAHLGARSMEAISWSYDARSDTRSVSV